jgi:hydrogenase nickel incorporation protein HypB
MCATCGCSGGTQTDGHGHGHEHGDGHGHEHAHGHGQESRILKLEQDVLAKNDLLAARNRAWLQARQVVALNVMSAPGAGKTTLLESTLRALAGDVPIGVIEGDQETSRDADRIRAAGGRAVQINTGRGCHLDAQMVAGALEELDPPPRSLVLVENVGNLVCPALFDLGERARVVISSVTEGDDKPLKYPHMFQYSDVLVLNKIDLLPHVPFDVDVCLAHARKVSPRLRVFHTSAWKGAGVDAWCGWLREQVGGAALGTT